MFDRHGFYQPPKIEIYGVQTRLRALLEPTKMLVTHPTGEFHSDQATHEEHSSGYNGYTATRHDHQFLRERHIGGSNYQSRLADNRVDTCVFSQYKENPHSKLYIQLYLSRWINFLIFPSNEVSQYS